MIVSCQTTPSQPTPEAKQKLLLEQEKALIRNALDSGRPETALTDLRSLVREYPGDASIQNLMGLTQLALKNGPRAVRYFQIAYKIDKQVSTGLNLSSALIEAGDHDHAVRLLTALIKQAERDNYAYKERIYHNLGYCYARQNRQAKAEQWFRQALEENPTFFPSHLELARLYEKTRRPAMAMKSYRQSMDYCLVCFEPVQALTSLYMQTGRQGEARKILVQYGKIEGVSPEDRARAGQMLNQITTAGLAPTRRGG